MLFISNRQDLVSSILNDKNIRHKEDNGLLTSNKVFFKSEYLASLRRNGMKTVFSETLGSSMLPKRSFGIVFADQIMVHSESNLYFLMQTAINGIIFPFFEPNSFVQFFSGVKEYQRDIERQQSVKLQRDAMEEAFKKEKAEWKELKAAIKEENEQILAAFEEAKKTVPEAAQQFMQPPALREIPPKPEEPKYPELPKVVTLRDRFLNVERSLVWKIFHRFEYCSVKGSNLGLMKKREKPLTPTIENYASLKIDEITLEEFYEYVNKHNVDGVNAKELRQFLGDTTAVELYAEIDETISELKFSEEHDAVNILPPLAPIKPMHAASMLAGGIGEFYKEVVLDGEKYALKAAIVKEPATRISVINGKEITEVIEQNIQKLGVYNVDRRNFRILG